MLTDVFAECVRKLEPGGRIAVNVANLGRKPYRSLSADVIRILEDDLGLLLRGELIWQKADGRNGSCAWGSFRSAANPVLRDVTERVVVASKGRFDRARSAKRRAAEGLPHESTLLTRRLPRPPRSTCGPSRPRALGASTTPRRSRSSSPSSSSSSTRFGTTSCSTRSWGAARRSSPPPGWAGATSATTSTPSYVDIARRRVSEALAEQLSSATRTALDGQTATTLAEDVVVGAGFRITGRKRRITGTGVTVDLVAAGDDGSTWFFLVCGAHTSRRGGWRGSTRYGGRSGERVRSAGGFPTLEWSCSPPACPPQAATATWRCSRPATRCAATRSTCSRWMPGIVSWRVAGS